MKLEIIKTEHGWKYNVNVGGLRSDSFSFNSAKDALEAGNKKLLELLPKETFDFGKGLVAAHQHPNGGGWVANTAHVDETAFIGPNARVYEQAKVHDLVYVIDNAQVYGNAQLFNCVMVKDQAKICGNTIIEGTVHVTNDIVFSSIKISNDMRITRRTL